MTSEPHDTAVPRRRIDPLSPTVAGTYRDELVEVTAHRQPRPARSLHTVRTAHFDVAHSGRRIRVDHYLPPERVDDDLAGILAGELFGPGWLRGPELFERIFTGVVRSTAPDAIDAWEIFYRNTLDAIARAVDQPSPEPAHGTIADYAPVYRHAAELLGPGSVLELGSCFGFLSLRLAASGRPITASDLAPGTMRLLSSVAPRLNRPVRTVTADAAHFPGAARCEDNVLAIHLLEHLDHAHGDRVVSEALRLAARRVVVAVPLEDEADETWGHVRTVTLDDLSRWGARSGRDFDVHEHHGGWLVVETAP